MTLDEADDLYLQEGLRMRWTSWESRNGPTVYYIEVGFEVDAADWVALGKGRSSSIDAAFVAAMELYRQRIEDYAATRPS